METLSPLPGSLLALLSPPCQAALAGGAWRRGWDREPAQKAGARVPPAQTCGCSEQGSSQASAHPDSWGRGTKNLPLRQQLLVADGRDRASPEPQQAAAPASRLPAEGTAASPEPPALAQLIPAGGGTAHRAQLYLQLRPPPPCRTFKSV